MLTEDEDFEIGNVFIVTTSSTQHRFFYTHETAVDSQVDECLLEIFLKLS